MGRSIEILTYGYPFAGQGEFAQAGKIIQSGLADDSADTLAATVGVQAIRRREGLG
jgi:hypothetical protein